MARKLLRRGLAPAVILVLVGVFPSGCDSPPTTSVDDPLLQEVSANRVPPGVVLRGPTARELLVPIYIVDGERIEGDLPLDTNMEDFDVAVVKGKGAAALFGADGARRGVIYLTTKKPKKKRPVRSN
ncbi:hypothetical protein ACFL5A_05230 [Gemmatimonadota bacterium]